MKKIGKMSFNRSTSRPFFSPKLQHLGNSFLFHSLLLYGMDEHRRTGEWKNHLEKIAIYARANTKNRQGVLVIQAGQLDQNVEAEVRCEYFKASRLIRCLIPEEMSDEDYKKKQKKKRPHVSIHQAIFHF